MAPLACAATSTAHPAESTDASTTGDAASKSDAREKTDGAAALDAEAKDSASAKDAQVEAGDGGSAPNRGPATFQLPDNGNPNGLFWVDGTQTLYIADNQNNRVLTYTDAKGIVKLVDLPAVASNGPGLGQLVVRSDGSILVTRFGFGTEGSVVLVRSDLTASVIPNLDATRERIGLTVVSGGAQDGEIFDTYFMSTSTGYAGAVAKLTLDGTETDVITGLTKPVGVLAVGTTLFADDQQGDNLYSAPLSSPSTDKVIAALPDADLLCVGPSGSLFSGGSDGNVRQINSSGVVSVFQGGFDEARGVAYDPTNKRLFVSAHGTLDALEIVPVP